MLLFRHNPEKTREPPEGSAVHQAARAIAGVILNGQEQAALHLNRRFKALSQRTQQGCLVLFCLLFGSCCLWLLLQALWPGTPDAVQAALPPSLTAPVREEAGIPPDLHPQELQRLQRIRGRLNALSRTAAGRHLRDSLLQARPSLLDSIHFLEQLQLESNPTP